MISNILSCLIYMSQSIVQSSCFVNNCMYRKHCSCCTGKAHANQSTGTGLPLIVNTAAYTARNKQVAAYLLKFCHKLDQKPISGWFAWLELTAS